MLTIDEFTEEMEKISEELPEEFYNDLNGGILILPDTRVSPHSRANDLYIMGMYRRSSSMGRFIEIYYGSFVKLFSHLPKEALIEQMREVLFHEFTHHIESLAGERGLEIKDEKQIQAYLAQFKGKRK
ncbi:MAG: metallopeptidase family protein [Firmicutes bacterium]|nr:metallopeptidase family protein [Bacillota bacterium]